MNNSTASDSTDVDAHEDPTPTAEVPIVTQDQLNAPEELVEAEELLEYDERFHGLVLAFSLVRIIAFFAFIVLSLIGFTVMTVLYPAPGIPSTEAFVAAALPAEIGRAHV